MTGCACWLAGCARWPRWPRWLRRGHCVVCGTCRRLFCKRVCKDCLSGRLCGVRRQPWDARDVRFRVPWPPPPLPRAFSLPRFPAVLDQNGIGACAVNACAVALSYCMAQAGLDAFHPSRMFMYYNTRRYVAKAPDMAVDTGCNLRDVCKAVAKFGACDEVTWPYTRRLLGVQPPPHLYLAARRLPRCSYVRVSQTLPGIVSCLLHRHPVVMGMGVFAAFRRVHEDGVMGMPDARDKQLGAHAVIVCGYDLDAGRFIVQNCWGQSWGNKGLFEVPFAFVLNETYCWDLWALMLTPEPL